MAGASYQALSSRPDTDGDKDHNNDEGLVGEGQEVFGRERSPIVATVRRYYTLAAAHDGASACLMLVPTLAKVVAVDHGQFGYPHLRGRTCSIVLSQMFRIMHHQLASDAATMKVVEVRVEGNHAFALLHTTMRRRAKIRIERQNGSWRIASLFATE